MKTLPISTLVLNTLACVTATAVFSSCSTNAAAKSDSVSSSESSASSSSVTAQEDSDAKFAAFLKTVSFPKSAELSSILKDWSSDRDQLSAIVAQVGLSGNTADDEAAFKGQIAAVRAKLEERVEMFKKLYLSLGGETPPDDRWEELMSYFASPTKGM